MPPSSKTGDKFGSAAFKLYIYILGNLFHLSPSSVRVQRLGITFIFDLTDVKWSNMDYTLTKTLLSLFKVCLVGQGSKKKDD